MKNIFILFFIIIAVSNANADELVIDKLIGEYGFEMEFKQSNQYRFLKKPKVSKGRLTVSKNKNFVWEIFGDNAGKIIHNGKTTWVYAPAEEEDDAATVIISSDIGGIQSVLLNPSNKISTLKKKNALLYTKINGDKKAGYLWAELLFTQEPDFRIDSVIFQDVESTKVTISVTSFKRLNKEPNPEMFNFKVPAGATVVNK